MYLICTSKHLIAFAAVLPFLSVIIICFYRLWLHPLAKYPGPFWARVTNLYAAYHSWKGDLHIDIWRCHERYGEHIRYGPDRLVFNTATALKDIYVVGNNIQKSKGYLSMMHRVANTLTQRDKSLHAKQRRLLSHGFSEAALRAYEEPLADHISIFCKYLSQDVRTDKITAQTTEQWSLPKDMAHWCDYVTFDITLDIVYGFKSRMISAPDNRPLLEALNKSNVRVGVMIPLYFLKNTFLDRWIFPSAIMARYVFIGFVRKLLLDRGNAVSETEERPSIFQVLLKANGGEGLSQNEIASELCTNLGFETTSTVLAALFFYLSRYPKCYEKAIKEVRNMLSSAHEVHDRLKVNKCTYLRACIDECMRMSPPVPASPFREVQIGGTTIDGQQLPGGCDVGTGIYSIHHSSKYFPEPHTFIPERWLGNGERGTKVSLALAQSAYNPFSVGSRQCIGKGLAMMEMMSIFATVLHKFDFKIADGEAGLVGEGKIDAELGRNRVKEFQLYDHVIATKSGPLLQFRARSPHGPQI